MSLQYDAGLYLIAIVCITQGGQRPKLRQVRRMKQESHVAVAVVRDAVVDAEKGVGGL